MNEETIAGLLKQACGMLDDNTILALITELFETETGTEIIDQVKEKPKEYLYIRGGFFAGVKWALDNLEAKEDPEESEKEVKE